jgi:hypothetical protein
MMDGFKAFEGQSTGGALMGGYNQSPDRAVECLPEYAAKIAEQRRWMQEQQVMQAIQTLQLAERIRADQDLMNAIRVQLRSSRDELAGLLDQMG